MMKTWMRAIAFSAAALAGSSALAATTTYTASSAIGSGSDHSLWISTGLGSGIGTDFNFSPDGVFKLFDTGATLTGTVVSQDVGTDGFTLAFDYGIPGWTPQFKSENSSVENGAIYRDLTGGTLTGFGSLLGLVLSVNRMPDNNTYAVQIGAGTATNNGANNKNKNFGMAHWMSFTIVQSTCSICTNSQIVNLAGKQGDINVDLAFDPNNQTGQVPLPAAGLLLLGALGGLGFAARRRKAA